jgi:vacuolar-type H+-ATPase subunit H
VPGLEELPEDIGSDPGLTVWSQFYFNVIERVAAPASPFLFLWDLLLGGLGLRGGIVRDAQEFLEELLEVNSSRVQSDVDERLHESRKTLETEIKRVLREASDVADRSLARARTAQSAGTSVVEGAVARLAAVEREIRGILPRGTEPKALVSGQSQILGSALVDLFRVTLICCAESVRNAGYVFATYLSTRSLAFCPTVHGGFRPKDAVLHFAAAHRRATRSRRRSG